MKDFIYRYRILIVLFLLVFILIGLKIKYGNNISDISTDKITPTVVVDKKYPSFEELKNMSDESYLKYLESLNEDELEKLPEEEYGKFYLSPFFPYETETFIVKKYIKENVLLVKSKISDMKMAEVDLRKWLDLVEENLGENQIVWE